MRLEEGGETQRAKDGRANAAADQRSGQQDRNPKEAREEVTERTVNSNTIHSVPVVEK